MPEEDLHLSDQTHLQTHRSHAERGNEKNPPKYETHTHLRVVRDYSLASSHYIMYQPTNELNGFSGFLDAFSGPKSSSVVCHKECALHRSFLPATQADRNGFRTAVQKLASVRFRR